MNGSDQTTINRLADGHRLAAVAHLEAHHGLDARLADGVAHLRGTLVINRNGLFDDEVLAGLRRGDRLRRMHRMRRTDVDNVDFGILQHLVVVAIELERQSVFLRQFRFGVGAPRTDRGDLDPFDFFQCLDMRASDPTETDNSGFE
ncbi:MAG: hypothetical protein U0R19_08290 [Bryobacteraceae bacterium]